jgi:uncharacterized protein YodC (DUF2158 family)
MPVLTKRSATACALMLAVSLCFSASAFAAQLKRGDLVRLRSGGPVMTVETVDDDQVKCIWSDLNGQPTDATFPVNVLQKF